MLSEGISLAIILQEAVVRCGTSVLMKKEIQPSEWFYSLCIDSHPDLHVFTRPLALCKLAMFVLDGTPVVFCCVLFAVFIANLSSHLSVCVSLCLS